MDTYSSNLNLSKDKDKEKEENKSNKYEIGVKQVRIILIK